MRTVVGAAHAVVAHAGRPAAHAVPVVDARLVAHDEVRVLVGGLLDIVDVAGALLVEPNRGRGDGQRDFRTHDLVHGVEAVVAVVADDPVGVIHETTGSRAGLRLNGTFGRGSQPGVPVQIGRRFAVGTGRAAARRLM